MKPETMARKDARTAETLPVFQHRHFAAIAAVFMEDAARDARITQAVGENTVLNYAVERGWLAERLALMFERSNPRFDRARFLRACGVAS